MADQTKKEMKRWLFSQTSEPTCFNAQRSWLIFSLQNVYVSDS